MYGVPPGRLFRVRIEAAEEEVRIEVRDSGPGRPAVQSPRTDSENGRGLLLVGELADAWGDMTTDRLIESAHTDVLNKLRRQLDCAEGHHRLRGAGARQAPAVSHNSFTPLTCPLAVSLPGNMNPVPHVVADHEGNCPTALWRRRRSRAHGAADAGGRAG
ncbi:MULTISPECIES: ATP-binding protein [Streptomyces]|uniref:ATP-binding protein n=1 Tax=Streptomyces TaxID=1883 RepID=UPI002D7F867B|nr:ATP-binding protein [Streptomyces sp. GMR22]